MRMNNDQLDVRLNINTNGKIQNQIDQFIITGGGRDPPKFLVGGRPLPHKILRKNNYISETLIWSQYI